MAESQIGPAGRAADPSASSELSNRTDALAVLFATVHDLTSTLSIDEVIRALTRLVDRRGIALERFHPMWFSPKTLLSN